MSTVRVRVDEGAGIVTLADPGGRNALSRQLADGLRMNIRGREGGLDLVH